jgi:hypothetical protein
VIRTRLLSLLALVCISTLSPQVHAVTIPAFPGAEGFGAVSVGGRGGDVYHVTSLADSGPGTLRDGIDSANGPRTIVFDVAGTIMLESMLRIRNPFLTIAGQTAPGEGICVREYSLLIKNTHDIVIRYMRFRLGDIQTRAKGRPTSSAGLDVVSIDDSKNVIFDHVSLSWSCDEVFGIVQNENVTIQWCIISEPLGDPLLHPYGSKHAYGLNTSANTLSVHHNLVANYVMRGPQFEANDAVDDQGYDVLMESVNNVLFGYQSSGSRYTTGIEDYPERAESIAFRFHLLNNYYIRQRLMDAPDIQATTKHGVTDQLRVYVAGNIGPNRRTNDLDPWKSVYMENGPHISQADSAVQAQMSNQPLFTPPIPITMQPAEVAYVDVLRDVGCSIRRDSVDIRVIGNVRDGFFRPYLSSQEQVGGWPDLQGGTAPLDADGDGMPDAWESSNGLNNRNHSDGNDDRDNDGYTNLEEYLNSLITVPDPTPVMDGESRRPSSDRLRVMPNPFNAEAVVIYRVDQPGHVNLTLHDITGQFITQLHAGSMTRGTHRFALSGQNIGSGVYIVRMVSGTEASNARLVMVR